MVRTQIYLTEQEKTAVLPDQWLKVQSTPFREAATQFTFGTVEVQSTCMFVFSVGQVSETEMAVTPTGQLESPCLPSLLS